MRHCDQVAIADLKDFQLIIPTTTQVFPKAIFSTWVDIPKRLYAEEGWMVTNGGDIAALHGLAFDTHIATSTPFQLSQRLGPGVPISFESRSMRSLPAPLLAQAILSCCFPETSIPFYAVFRGFTPRFVRVYPWTRRDSLAEMADMMLADEQQFIATNYTRLRTIPFYQEQFGL
ncbi:hypothetical protein [Acaryochloris sp. IP29b_bin.148]|uniref:hypothetical protein n=1 Tax=Acaryochloris sp. IP29b_bin.148 TaxID=2969218 RepID=UPI00260A8CF9|nr:hypothetical protein [Acaryochloris sp. IP29b_bin.148]